MSSGPNSLCRPWSLPFSDHSSFFFYWSCLVILPGLFLPNLHSFQSRKKIRGLFLHTPEFPNSPREGRYLCRELTPFGHVLVSGIGISWLLCTKVLRNLHIVSYNDCTSLHSHQYFPEGSTLDYSSTLPSSTTYAQIVQ